MDKTAEQTTVTYNVRLPYIVNTKPIAADEKVILEWQLKEKRKLRRRIRPGWTKSRQEREKGSARRKITMHKEVGTWIQGDGERTFSCARWLVISSTVVERTFSRARWIISD